MKKIIGFCIVAASLTACNYQKNNTIAQKDVREGDTYVYGVHPDSAARQTLIKYTAKPELQAKADKIKEKLYSK